MNVRYRVTLETSERAQLATMVLGGKGAYRRLERAQILLAADSGIADNVIARNVSVGTSTVYRTKQRFVEEGLERAPSELPRAGAERKLGVSDESLLVAVACSDPPVGRSRWTLQLLADEMVRLTEHESVSDETIRCRLGELQLKPWQEKMWCIPKVDAEAEHGRDRDRRKGAAMPQPPHRRQGNARLRDREVGAPPQPRRHPDRLDVYGRPRSRQARSRLPSPRRSSAAASAQGSRVNRSEPLWPWTSGCA